MAESKAKASLADDLYDRCNKDAANSPELFMKVFNQASLLALCDSEPLDEVTNARRLMPIIQELTDNGLFIVLKTKAGSCWGLRPRDAAAKIRTLDRNERIVYGLIEESHENGIWIKNIKTKTGIKDVKAMDKIVSNLQRLCLVKSVKNIKAPVQRTYILYHLAPSDEVTGGSFYDAGDLDESLVEELCNLVVFQVRQMSWGDDKKKKIKRDSSPIIIRDDAEQTTEGAAESRGRKNKRKRDPNATSQHKDIEDAPPPHKRRSHKHSNDPEIETPQVQLAFPADHDYPTAIAIHDFLTHSDVIRAAKAASLTVDEVQNVLNVLVWDEKLEEVNGGYRTVRGVKFKQPGEVDDPEEELARKRGNGFTEMPCGQCPVIDLCGTDGPINAANCVYFNRWLGRAEVAA